MDKEAPAGLANAPVGPAISPAGKGKEPRTARGEKTLRKILDAALLEFGQRGFHDSSIVGITSRADVALGTFYTYFDSKEALFAALVRDMSTRVKALVPPATAEARDALDAEARTQRAYLEFVLENKEVYRIIDEAEFVDPEGFRAHYESAAARIAARLEAGVKSGQMRHADDFETEVHAWAYMGMNVFLGLRYCVWERNDPKRIAKIANRLLRRRLQP